MNIEIDDTSVIPGQDRVRSAKALAAFSEEAPSQPGACIGFHYALGCVCIYLSAVCLSSLTPLSARPAVHSAMANLECAGAEELDSARSGCFVPSSLELAAVAVPQTQARPGHPLESPTPTLDRVVQM